MPYIGALAVLTALQSAAVSALLPLSPTYAVAAAWALQLCKLPVSVRRLRAMGRSTDDAVLGLVPLANLGLFRLLAGADPSAKKKEKAIASWTDRTSAAGAVWLGLQTAARAPLAVLGLSVLVSLPLTVVGFRIPEAVAAFQTWSPEDIKLTADGLKVVTAVLLLYTVLQWTRRNRVTRASWIPSLLLFPVFMMAGLSHLVSSGAVQNAQMGLVVLSLAIQAWYLVYNTFVGAFLANCWTSLGLAASRGEELPDIATLFGHGLAKLRQVSGAHGARVLAVTLGMQVVIPGIVYALQYAFVDAAAALEPDEPSLKRSSKLTRGTRRRIFKVFAFVLLAQSALQMGLGILLVGFEAVNEAMFVPTAMGFFTTWLWDFLGVVFSAVTGVAFVHLYLERRREKEPDAPELVW